MIGDWLIGDWRLVRQILPAEIIIGVAYGLVQQVYYDTF